MAGWVGKGEEVLPEAGGWLQDSQRGGENNIPQG